MSQKMGFIRMKTEVYSSASPDPHIIPGTQSAPLSLTELMKTCYLASLDLRFLIIAE